MRLKPCPFCGGHASGDGVIAYSEQVARDLGLSQCTYYFVNCIACGVSNQGLGGYPSRAKAIAAWNRRSSLEDTPIIMGR